MSQRPLVWKRVCGIAALACVLCVTISGALAQQSAPGGPGRRPATIGVLPFVDATVTGGTGIGVTLSGFVQAEFVRSTNLAGRVMTIPDGLRPEQIDQQRAIELGRAQNVDAVLIGTILEATAGESNSSGSLPGILRQSGGVNVRSAKASVMLQGVVFHVATGERLANLRIPGRHTDRKFGGTLYSSLGQWSSNDQRFLDSPLGKALRGSVSELVRIIAASPALESGSSPPKAIPQSPMPAKEVSRERPKGCSLVTEAEMSSILGRPVVAKGKDHPVQASCTYTPASGVGPYAELRVDWGDGQAGMRGAGIAGRAEPGITDPLAGIGDQAVMMGPAMMIRAGDDLVTIVLSGVDNPVAKARVIFATAKPRM